MSDTLFSTDLLSRLRRSVLLGGVVLFSMAATACSDDDDDGDDISGPVADCIDEIDFDDFWFDENDIEALELGDSESGRISTSDPSLEFEGGTAYYDIWVFALESQSDIRVTVNPSDDFDPDFQPYSITTGLEGDYENNAGPGENEIVEYINVPEGCYMIWSSAADFEGTGSYTIEVDEV